MFISKISSTLRILLSAKGTDEDQHIVERQVESTKPTQPCEWCGTPYHPASVKNRFCSQDCRKAAESKRRKAERAAARAPKPEIQVETEEPEVPEPRAEEPKPKLVRVEVVTPEQPVTLAHMNSLVSEARCSESDSINLPWVSSEPSNAAMNQMMNLCLDCPILYKCALYAQREETSGTWAAAMLNMGKVRTWMCPNCHIMNEGSYDLCPACKRVSIPFRAQATLAAREGRTISPRRKPLSYPIPTLQVAH